MPPKKTASETESMSAMKEGSPLGVRPDAISKDGSFVPHVEGVVQDGSASSKDDDGEKKSSKK